MATNTVLLSRPNCRNNRGNSIPGAVPKGTPRFTWYNPIIPGESPANPARISTPFRTAVTGSCVLNRLPLGVTAPNPVQYTVNGCPRTAGVSGPFTAPF